jgi:electron transfer flavoprotein beta subunit
MKYPLKKPSVYGTFLPLLTSSEKKHASEIVAVSIGPAKSQETLRTALAMGADRAVHVLTPDGIDVQPLQIAKLLKAVAIQEKSDIILLGKQGIEETILYFSY